MTLPRGDDGQLMFDGCAPPVLWLSTDAVQLTVPIGDDGQLMSDASGAPPVLGLSTAAIQFVCRLRRALFRSSFAFLFSVRQTFPFQFRSSFPFFRLFRSSFVLLFCSSDFSVPIRSSFPFFFPLVTFETVGFSDSKVIFNRVQYWGGRRRVCSVLLGEGFVFSGK